MATLLLLALSLGGDQPPVADVGVSQWIEFTPPDKSCSVRMPHEPKAYQPPRATFTPREGSVPAIEIYDARLGERQFTLHITRYADGFLQQRPIEDYLDHRHPHMTEQMLEQVPLSDPPGREYFFWRGTETTR